jgi:RNA polymerase sigma-70 factor (ECF subfamily)
LVDWSSIVREHGPMAFDAAWRVLGHAADAEDVVQEAMLDALRLHEREPVSNWGGLLRQLAVRRAIDRLRQRRESVAAGEPLAPRSDQPDAAVAERELALRLRSALAQLPDREAMVFSLRYFGEMAGADIASTLGMTTEGVAVTLHRARDRLKRLLEGALAAD